MNRMTHAHRRCRIAVIAMLCVSIITALAPESASAEEWNADEYSNSDRMFSIRYPKTVTYDTFVFSIDHRAFAPVDEDPFENLLGFDSGNMKIGLGLRFGLFEKMDIGLSRFNGTTETFDVYEFSARFQALSDADSFCDLAVVAGAAWFDDTVDSDEFHAIGEVHAGRSFGNRIYLTAGGIFHSGSSGMTRKPTDDAHSVALALSASLHLNPNLAIGGEASVPIDGFDDGEPFWAIGPRFATWGHTFSLVLSNSQGISTDRLSAGASGRDPIFGFTITREM